MRLLILTTLVLTGLIRCSRADILLEAENATLTGNAYVSHSVAGYSGTGYVTGLQSASDTINWTFTGTPGLYEMIIRYRTPNGQKGFAGVINGHGFAGMFPATNVFSSFDNGLVQVISGSNTLQIGGNWNWYEIDAVRLVPATLPPPPAALSGALCDPQATFAARMLMAALVADYGKITWTGQHNSADLSAVQSASGRLPAIVEGDFMEYSPSRIQYGSNPGTTTENYMLLDNSGYVLGFCWHWNAPTNLLNTASEPWWSGFYTAATTFDVQAALADTNSVNYALLLRDIDAIAVQLKKTSSNNIPVLWRPLHEASGGWFWWGAKGPAPFKALWRLLFNRLTGYHQIHNLIWVLTNEDPNWYPGDDVVDIVGVDAYPSDTTDPLSGNWTALKAQFDGKKLLTLSEFGGVPDVERMHTFGVWFSYFCCWSASYLQSAPAGMVSQVYNSPDSVTLDELNARPPAVVQGVQTNGGVVQVFCTGPHGAAFRLLGSGDPSVPMASWSVLTNRTMRGGSFIYSDLQATNDPARFYRVAKP
ncbi:MAG: glycosyl hydrolase [Verrucomicrobiota bacterium]